MAANKRLWQLSTRSPIALLLSLSCLLVAACADDDGDGKSALSAATALTTAGLFANDAGSIIFYEELSTQILDSDAVIVGRTIDVLPGGSEPGDESGPIEYIYNVVEVGRVIHSSGFARLTEGDRVRIVNIKPADQTVSQLRSLADGETDGVFLLFNAANLRQRLGDKSANASGDEWLLQTQGSIVLDGPDGQLIAIDELVPGLEPSSFEELVNDLRTQAEQLSSEGTRQPAEVLGALPPQR